MTSKIWIISCSASYNQKSKKTKSKQTKEKQKPNKYILHLLRAKRKETRWTSIVFSLEKNNQWRVLTKVVPCPLFFCFYLYLLAKGIWTQFSLWDRPNITIHPQGPLVKFFFSWLNNNFITKRARAQPIFPG